MAHSRSTRTFVYAGAIALAVASGRVVAQERPALVEVLGPRAYDIPVPRAVPETITLTILARQGKAAPKRLEFQDALLGGRAEGDWANAFKFAWKPATKSEYANIEVTIDPKWIRAAGAYAVNALAIAPGEKPDSPPVTQVVTFTFTRPAPTFSVAPTLKFEGTRAWPWSSGTLAPGTFTIAESSWRTALVDLKAGTTEPLKTSSGATATLALGLPAGLDAGTSAEITVKPIGRLPLGTSSGKLSIGSGQPTIVPVEIVTRLWRGWLVLPILLGIGIGYRVRVKGERTIELAKARIAANEQLARIRRAALGVRDETVRATIDGVAIALREQMTGDGEPATIVAAAQQAGRTVDDALKALEADRTTLQGQVATVRATLAGPLEDQAPPVRHAILAARTLLDGLDQELEDGRTGSVKRRLRALDDELDALIRPAISSWTDQVEIAMRRLGPWPGRSIETEKPTIAQQLTALRSAADRKARIDGAALLAREVRRNLFANATLDAVELAVHIRTGLGPDGVALDAPITAARAFVDGVPEADQIDRFAIVLSALRDALAGALTAAAGATDVSALLAEGRFEDALAALIAARPKPERALRPGAAQPELEVLPKAPAALAPIPITTRDTAPRCTITFRPPAAIAETPIELLLTAIPELTPTAVITWTIDGRPTRSEPGVATLILTPVLAGPLRVHADVVDDARPGSLPGSASISIKVLPGHRFEIADERRAQQSAERLRTVVAGAFIAGAGYLIFEAAFIGTFKDFFVPLLWGFTVDVGVARVQQFATPLAAKTPPL
jgi:hypothetical protein